jgi:hypothetical protein
MTADMSGLLDTMVSPLGDWRYTRSPSLPRMPLIKGVRITFAMVPAFFGDVRGCSRVRLPFCEALVMILCSSCVCIGGFGGLDLENVPQDLRSSGFLMTETLREALSYNLVLSVPEAMRNAPYSWFTPCWAYKIRDACTFVKALLPLMIGYCFFEPQIL